MWVARYLGNLYTAHERRVWAGAGSSYSNEGWRQGYTRRPGEYNLHEGNTDSVASSAPRIFPGTV